LIKDLVEIEEIGHTPKKSRLIILLNFSIKGKAGVYGANNPLKMEKIKRFFSL
jgi:hypothetical protein